jgi:hypothetical protein
MLPCTSLERFFIDDQAAGSDAMCHAVFEVGCLFDIRVISDSFTRTLRQHPILTAKIAWDKHGSPGWVASDSHFLTFDVAAFLRDLDAGAQINLETSGGVRALVQYLDDRMRIQLRFHHAVCDGLAIARFFKDWMSTCRAVTGGREIDCCQAEVRLLSNRGLPRWRSPVKIGRVTASVSLVRRFIQWVTSRPSPIQSDACGCEAGGAVMGEHRMAAAALDRSESMDLLNRIDCESVLHVLNCDQTNQLKVEASNAGITVNDFITSRLFLALRDFLDAGKCDCRPNSHVLRLGIPNSLRTRHDRRMPACIILGIAFIDQRVQAELAPAVLAHTISIETKEIRRWGGGQAFLDGLSMVQKCGPLYRMILRSDLCFASAIFSSLGDVSWIDPDLLLFCGKPPLRRNTNVAVFASMADGQLAITINLSRAALRADDRTIIICSIRDRLEAFGRGFGE